MKRLLVTGRDGFVGSTLVRMLESEPGLGEWSAAPLSADFNILEEGATDRIVRDAEPDAVLHLAAQSSVPLAFRDPAGTLSVNLFGTLNLLRALKQSGFSGPIVFVSSGDVYGLVPEAALPINETRLPEPRNPYAVSKIAAEALCHQWSVTEGMNIIIARPFNHIGSGQSEHFVIPAFARQIAEIRKGLRPPVIEVGDIDVTRDFTDVRDVVRAYFALLERGARGELYNVCSGVERSVRSLLETMIDLAGIEVEIRRDPQRMRPAEQRRAVGDASKLHGATGWRATTPIRESLAAVLQSFEGESKT